MDDVARLAQLVAEATDAWLVNNATPCPWDDSASGGDATVEFVAQVVRKAAQGVQDASDQLPVGRAVAALDAATLGARGSATAAALADVTSTLEREFAETRAAWLLWSQGGQDAIVAYAAADEGAAARLGARVMGASVAV